MANRIDSHPMGQSSPAASDRFPTTLWDRVRGAVTDPRALEDVLRVYHGPLVAHLHRARGLPLHDAEDLVQDFIARRVLGPSEFLGRADPGKGRFRSYLLTALENFRKDAVRRAACRKESPQRAQALENDMAGAGDEEPGRVFDVALGLTLLGRAVRRLEASCAARGRHDHWLLFEGRVLSVVCGGAPVPFAELAARAGFVSAKQAHNTFPIVQQRFRRCWEDVLAENLAADPTTESGELVAALCQAAPDVLEGLRQHLWGELPSTTRHEAPLNLAADFAELWGSLTVRGGDSGAILRDLLAAPLQFPDKENDSIEVIRDLFGCNNPPLDALLLVKDLSKEQRHDPDSPLPAEVSTALYYGAIAAALVGHGVTISEHPPMTLRQGLAWLQEQPWAEERLRALAAQALAVLPS